jgi:hypothetical protein
MKQPTLMRASITNIAAGRARREQNRKTALVLIGVMIFLMAVSIVTILVKN